MKSAIQELLQLYSISEVAKTSGLTYNVVREQLVLSAFEKYELESESFALALYLFMHEKIEELLENFTNSQGHALTQTQCKYLTEGELKNSDAITEELSGEELTVNQIAAGTALRESVWAELEYVSGNANYYRLVGDSGLVGLWDKYSRSGGNAELWGHEMLEIRDFLASSDEGATKEYPGILVVQVMNPLIQLGQNNAAAASIFINHLPPIEMGKAAPYFNLKIIDPAQPFRDDGTLADNFSIFSSLMLGGESPASATKAMAGGQFGSEPSETIATHIGMEAFTAPQTLVNWKKNRDPGRPLMSLLSFKVNVAPSRGAMSTMTGELQLVLHDRSRLPEIQKLVRPDALGKLELLIEWGWSHPDRYTTAYGAMIDAMKVSQKFMVYQSSFTMQDGGSVQISLKMVTKGTSAANWTDAAMSGKVEQNWLAVKKAYEAVQAVRTSALNQLPSSADVAGKQEISTLSLSSTGMLVDDESSKKIEAFITKYKNKTGDLSELAGHLDDLATAVEAATETLEGQLEKKLECIKRLKYKEDPYVVYFWPGGGSKGAYLGPTYFGLQTRTGSPFAGVLNNRDVCSFGTICYHFMAVPLAASQAYDDVQMIFYSANKNAGWAGGINLGQIPIDMRDIGGKSFEDLLKAEYKKYGGQYPVTKLIAWITSNFIENQYALCYGFQHGTSASKEGNENFKISEEGNIVPRDPGSDPGKVAQANEKKLKNAYYGDENSSLPAPFKPINVRIVFEVLQGEPETFYTDHTTRRNEYEQMDDQGATKRTSSSGSRTWHLYTAESQARTILRIHILDEAAGAKDGVDEILRKVKSTSTGLIRIDEVDREYIYPAHPWAKGWTYINQAATKDTAEMFSAMIAMGLLEEEKQAAPPHLPLGTKDGTQALLDAEKAKPEADQNSALISHLEARLIEFSAGGEMPVYYKINATPKRLAEWFRREMPYMLWGTEGTMIKQLSAATSADSKLASFYMVKAAKNSGADGAVDRGLPMTVMPVSMNATLVGCPLVQFMQQYFVDMGTGTTLDNRYRVIGVSHDIKPGEYTTNVNFVPGEGYAEFRSALGKLAEFKKTLNDLIDASASTPTPAQ